MICFVKCREVIVFLYSLRIGELQGSEFWNWEGPKSSRVRGHTWPYIMAWIKSCCDGDCSHEIKRHLLFGRKAVTNLDSVLKSRDITLLTKVHIVKAMIFPVWFFHVWMWELDHKEGWAPKNWCFRPVVLEKTLESPLLQGDQTRQS